MSRSIWLCLALLVLARAVAGIAPSMWAWGFPPIRFLDPVTGWGLWIVSAVALAAGWPSSSQPGTPGWTDRLDAYVLKSRRATWTAAACGAGLVWILFDRTWFIGDFLIRQGHIESGLSAGSFATALPLDRFLHGTALRAVGGGGSLAAANLALRSLGALEAAALAVLAIWLARELRPDGPGAAATAAVVFFGGYLTVFTGLGKPASELCVLVAATALTGMRALRGGSLLPLGVTVALAVSLHRSGVFLLPAWLWVTVASLARSRPFGACDWAGLLAPIAAGAFSLPRVFALAVGFDLPHHVLVPETRAAGVLAVAFAPRHLLGVANLMLALAPLAPVLPAILPRLGRAWWRSPEGAVPATLAASFVPALLFIHPQQGLFRDWDVFAPAGMALSILVAAAIAPLLATPRSRLAVAVMLAALVPAIQWLALNRQYERGLNRIRAYALEAPRPSDHERALTWDFLTLRYFGLQRWNETAEAAREAVALAPHRRLLLTLGLAETMRGDHRAAAAAYRRQLARDPEDPLGWLGLAGAATRLGDRGTAERAVEKLRGYEPDGEEMREIRRHHDYYPEVFPGPLP